MILQVIQCRIRRIFIKLRLALGILELYVLIYIKSIFTIEGFEDFLLDGFDRLHNVFLRPKRVLHSLAVGAYFPLMMGVRLCLDLLALVYVGELLEAISEGVMVLLIFEEFIDEVGDACSKGIIVVLSVSVDQDVAMFKGSLIAVYGDLLDVLAHLWQEVIAVQLEELDQVFLLERGND